MFLQWPLYISRVKNEAVWNVGTFTEIAMYFTHNFVIVVISVLIGEIKHKQTYLER